MSKKDRFCGAVLPGVLCKLFRELSQTAAIVLAAGGGGMGDG